MARHAAIETRDDPRRLPSRAHHPRNKLIRFATDRIVKERRRPPPPPTREAGALSQGDVTPAARFCLDLGTSSVTALSYLRVPACLNRRQGS